MTLQPLKADDSRLQFPALYNIHPVFNENHPTGKLGGSIANILKQPLLDTYYGRVFTPSCPMMQAVYGLTERMNYYVELSSCMIVDELRVPYRRIPVFDLQSLEQLSRFIDELKRRNPDHTILVRGQGKTYKVRREPDETMFLYGENVEEPSFMPSFQRANFSELTLQSIWHCQAAMLLNDVGYDYQSILPTSAMREYWDDIRKLRGSWQFDGFALGLAQHYGLPSVGLDLTDDCNIAAWFALNSLSIDDSGVATSRLLPSEALPTIFVFRCPIDTVFEYKKVRPKVFPQGRPDRQNAWFAHVGWGDSVNQLASYLMCGFRLRAEVAEQLPENYWRILFPSIEDDLILRFFVAMKNQRKYEGEAKRALQRVYYFE